jgi:hypothetical protein
MKLMELSARLLGLALGFRQLGVRDIGAAESVKFILATLNIIGRVGDLTGRNRSLDISFRKHVHTPIQGSTRRLMTAFLAREE